MANIDDKTILDTLDAGKINLTYIRRQNDGSWEYFDRSKGPAFNKWVNVPDMRTCLTGLINNPAPAPKPAVAPAVKPSAAKPAAAPAVKKP